MEESESVIEQEAKPVVSRPRSSVAFPYYSLNKSIEVARAAHQKAGGQCERDQLASLLGYSGLKNGGFLTRLSAAKMFGLIETRGETVVLTDRAKRIISPVYQADADQARLDAFLSVDLYKKVFDDFEGQTLPDTQGLINLLTGTHKVVPNQITQALRIMMDSAESAGLFKLGGRTKFVRPIIGNGRPAATPAPEPSAADQPPADKLKRNDHRSPPPPTKDVEGMHPALVGLLQTLPPVGSTLGPKRRSAVVDAFKSTINVIYPEEEE